MVIINQNCYQPRAIVEAEYVSTGQLHDAKEALSGLQKKHFG